MVPGPARVRRPSAGGPRRGAFGGALVAWLPLLCVALAAGALTWVHVERRSRAPATPTGPEPMELWIDPLRADLLAEPSWTDPRWLERIAGVLEDQGARPLADAPGHAELAARLEELSFVEKVLVCAPLGDGLALELALRRPVACVEVLDQFALVDADGVVLEGRWPMPPRLGRATLPVLGLGPDPLLQDALAGDWLVEREHLDALAVALSMEQHLDEAERAALGEVRIDAGRAPDASVHEPGVRLALEGDRTAYFGRSPADDAPGELDEAVKWRSLARAVALYGENPLRWDWERVDLRWDRPDLALRNRPTLAQVGGNASPAAPTRERPRAEPSGPRVR